MDRSQEIGNTILTLTTHNLTGTHKGHCVPFRSYEAHMRLHSPHGETFGGEGGSRMEHKHGAGQDSHAGPASAPLVDLTTLPTGS
jgi:hypothetical protein